MARGLNLSVVIGAKIGPTFASTTRTVEQNMRQMMQRVNRTAAEMKAVWSGAERRVGSFGSAARDAVYSVGAPMAALSAMGMRAAYEWSKVGNDLQSVTQMSDVARKRIEDVARAMPGKSADNLSAALDLARTGFGEQAILGTIGTTIKLAKSDPRSVDQAQAADIMTNVMTGMRLYSESMTAAQVKANAERVANNLAFGASQSSSDVRLMGESFKYAGPLAARLGIDIETLTGSFMTMANSGIKGSEAGVALRSGMVRLLKPTKAAMAVLDRFNMKIGDYVRFKDKVSGDSIVKSLQAQGIDARGAIGNIDRLLASDLSGGELVAKISQAVADGVAGGAGAMDLDVISDGVTNALMSGADKVDLMKFLSDARTKGWGAAEFVSFFDTRQGTRLSTLFDDDTAANIERVKAAMRGMDGTGSVLDKMYAMQMKGAVGPWERMQQGMSNLMISMAESGAMDAVADGMNAMAKAMMSLSKTSPGMLKFITLSILGLGLLAPLGLVISGLGAAFRLLAFPVGLANLALGKIAPRLVTTRIAMVGARYGIRAAVFEIIKDLMLLPVRAGAALGRVRGIFAAARAIGARGIAVRAGGAAMQAMSVAPLVGSLFRGLAAAGPLLMRGLAIAIGYLSNPAGWVALAVTAGLLIWTFRDQIASAWKKHIVPFFKNAWQGAKNWLASVNWGEVGLKVVRGIAFGLSFAWTKITTWLDTAWTGIVNFATSIDWSAVGVKIVTAVAWGLGAAWAGLSTWWQSAWPKLMDFVKSLSWGDVGMWIADRLTMGLASKINSANWGAIIKGAASGMDAIGKAGKEGWQAGQAAAKPTVGAKTAPGPKLAGKRAAGGPVIGSRLYLVGERGPELFRAPESGKIIPANDTARILAGGGGKVTSIDAGRATRQASGNGMSQSIHFTINGATDPEGVAREVERTLRRMGARQTMAFSD